MFQIPSSISVDKQAIPSGQIHSPYANDPRIVQASEENALCRIVPLVKNHQIKAAVMPCTYKEEFDRFATEIQWDALRPFSGTHYFDYKKTGELHTIDQESHHLVDQKTGELHLPPFIRQKIDLLGQFMHKSSPESSRTTVSIMLMLHPPGTEQGAFPEFHTDSLTIHTTLLGGALTYISGDLTKEQENFLCESPTPDFIQLRTDIGLHERIQTFKTGELILFEDDLFHCSTQDIKTTGQIALAAYPPALF